MAGETQSSSVTTSIYAKAIESLVLAYQYDDVLITPYCRYKSISDFQTTTASFTRLTKSALPASVGSETTVIGLTEFQSTATDVAVSRIGIAREITNTVLEDSVLARALSVQGLVADAARLYGEFFDTATTALFSSFTTILGSTGQPLSIPVLVSVVAQERASKAKGPLVISLHDNMGKQLQQAQAISTATPWQTFYTPNADSSQFCGYFMGAPVWASGLNPTSGGDRLGACFVDGQARPEYAALGFVVKRMPSSLEQPHILMDSNIWASFCRTGVGIIANNFGTGIRSVNA